MPLLAIHFLYFITILNPIIHVNLLGTLETNMNIGKGWEKRIRLGTVGYIQNFWLWKPCPSMLEFPKILFWKPETSGGFTSHASGSCKWLAGKFESIYLVSFPQGLGMSFGPETHMGSGWIWNFSHNCSLKPLPLPYCNVSTPLLDWFLKKKSCVLESFN